MGKPLPLLLDGARDGALVTPFLNELFQELLGSTARVRSVTSEVVKRRTLRYRVELEGTPAASWRLIGKVYESPAKCEEGFRALNWLSMQGFATRPPLSVTMPRALAILPDHALLIMEEAAGQSLKRLLYQGQAGTRELQLFADVLVKLHRFPAAYGAPFTLERHLEQRCAGLCGPLASAFPDLAEPIARILAVARQHADAATAGATLAHGDYHAGQVLLDAERQWLIDLDLLHVGDPAYDLAMVVLTLKGLGSRSGSAEKIRSLLEAFLARYFAHMDASIAERLPVNAALIFLKRACKRFRWQSDPAWEEDVRRQVRLGEECLRPLKQRRRARDLSSALELCASCPAAK